MIYFSFLWQFIFIQVYLFPPKNLTWHVSFILTCLSSFSVNDFHSLGNSFCPIWCSVLQDLVRFLKQMIWSQICSEEKSTTGTQTFPVCSVHHVFGKCDQSKPRTRSLLHKHSGGGAGTCRRRRCGRLQEVQEAAATQRLLLVSRLRLGGGERWVSGDGWPSCSLNTPWESWRRTRPPGGTGFTPSRDAESEGNPDFSVRFVSPSCSSELSDAESFYQYGETVRGGASRRLQPCGAVDGCFCRWAV